MTPLTLSIYIVRFFTLLLFITASAVSQAATFTVMNTSDSEPGSLREAIDKANGIGGADTITFDSSVTGTIELLSTLPNVTEALTITGPGATTLTIDANGTGRVFTFDSPTDNQSFTIASLTITGGNSTSLGGGVSVSTGDSLMINSSRIVSNTSSAGGGGIAHTGNLLVINDSTISQNQAAGGLHGGGIYFNGTLLSLEDSTVDQNVADGLGGGIYLLNPGQAMVIESAITENHALHGGGVSFSCAFSCPSLVALSFINTTISGNVANDHGGGLFLGVLFSGTTVNLSSVTLASNMADDNADTSGDGGGIFSSGSDVTINTKNTLIGDNIDKGAQANDCSATLNSLGYNLIEDTAGCTVDGDATGNLTGVDPILDALANNGGSTETHALQPLSPAVDAGNPTPTNCTDHENGPLGMDQRGVSFVRHIDGNLDGTPRCDIGAFELTVCGDEVLSGDEECDDGPANSDTTPDTCRTTCVKPACGDNVVDTDEACDDGNLVNGDGCSSTCSTEPASDPGDDDSSGDSTDDSTDDSDSDSSDSETSPDSGESETPPDDAEEDSDIGLDETESSLGEDEGEVEATPMPGSALASSGGCGCDLKSKQPPMKVLPFYLLSVSFVIVFLFLRNRAPLRGRHNSPCYPSIRIPSHRA